MSGRRLTAGAALLSVLVLILCMAAAGPALAADHDSPPAADLDFMSGVLPLGGVVAGPSQAVVPIDVLWDQPLLNSAAVATQDRWDTPIDSVCLADDFINTEPWSLESVHVPGTGWLGFSTLFNATQLTWQIYADDAGEPAGDPHGGGSPPVWSLSLAPTDAQISVTTGAGGLPSNTLLTLNTPLILPAGHWWLVFYPTMSQSLGSFGRYTAGTANGYSGQFINPGGNGLYQAGWNPWGTYFGSSYYDIAFRLEGRVANAKLIKEQAAADLRSLAGDCSNPMQRTIVVTAATYVELSVSPACWVDGCHLSKLLGPWVFSLKRSAVGQLKRGVRYFGLDPLRAGQVIDSLVAADRLLASQAIDDAIEACAIRWKTVLAQKHFDQGDSCASAGKAECAIGAYRSAWTAAVCAGP